jgi:filamentous hemagglutinin family protein
LRRIALASAAIVPALLAGPLGAQAVLPSGGSVVAGQAQILSPGAGQLRIDQSSARAVIDWQSFSVGAGGKVHFDNGQGATLNRVAGGDPSSIAGQLSATGSLWLMNPAGVIVGPDGRVTTGGSFLATTRSIAADAFMAGAVELAGHSTAGVVNAGTVEAGGDLVLVGDLVENRGTLKAGGDARLVSASRLVLREAHSDSRIHIELADGGAGAVTNSGRIEAAAAELRAVGGNVYALAADTSGVIRATGSRTEGGRILLVGGAGVTVGGTLDASGRKGGAIDVTAPGVHVTSAARISAAGSEADGGTIRIGGDLMGGPGLASADRLLVESGAEIDAGSAAARGGTVILWSEDWTRFEGRILADGATGGGFVETSSKGELGIENGEVLVGDGQWLLDPRNVIITTSGFAPTAPFPNPFVINPPAGPGAYTINRTALQNALNAGSNVTVTTTQAGSTDVGNLTVSSSIGWSGAGSLTLRADNDIIVSNTITSSGAGSIALNAARNITTTRAITASGSGSIVLDAGNLLQLGSTAAVTGGGGSMTLVGRGDGVTFTGSGNRVYRTNGGALTVSAPSLTGDILFGRTASNGNWQLYAQNGGSLTLTAGRDIQIGRPLAVAGWARVGRVADTGPVTITAGRNLSLVSSPVANAFGEIQSGGALTVTAPNLLVQSTTQSTSAVLSRGLSATITAGAATWNGRLDSTSNTVLAGGVHSFTVSPILTLGANRSFTLATGAAISSTTALAITTSGTGDIRFNGQVTGTTMVARSGDELTIGAPIRMNGSGTALQLGAGTKLINTAGQSLSAPNGRWLTYSVSPFVDEGWQDLNPDQPNLYGTSFGFLPPVSGAGTGNRRIFSFVPTLTLTGDSPTKTYGQTGPTLGFTASGLVPGDSLAVALTTAPTVTSAGTAPTANVGSYPVLLTGGLASGQGYALALVNGLLTVNPAPLSVVANAQTREYGLADPALTFSATGFVNGQNASVLGGTLVRSAGENVGSYAIGQGTLSNANYAISFTGAQFAITPAPLSVFATNVTRLYGGTDPSPLPFTTSGLRLSDTAATALTGALARAPGENVGSYAITQGTLAASNYTISYTPGTLRIDPATLSVVASNQSRLYGDADPALTFAASGFVLGDTAGTALTGTLLRAAGENVGSYAIGQGSLSASNYVIAFTPGSFVINPAPLSVAAFDATREYGLADPLFTFAATGFRLGDTASVLTGALGRNPGENVGSYAITQGTLAASNYAISFTPGTLSITPATLSVVADNQARAFGQPDPALTFQASGLRLSDTSASVLSGSLVRAPGESVGTYAITQGTLASNPNYVIAFTPGVFSIGQALLTVIADNKSRLYGDVDPALTFTASGFVGTDDVSILTGQLIRAAGENVGTYAITQGTLAAPNYAIAFTPGSFGIAPAPLGVVANAQTRLYGAADPSFTFAASGFRLGDTETSLTGALARAAGENVGTYAITQGTLANPNYTIAFTGAELAITPAPLSVVADAQTREYGLTDPALTFAASGFVLGDTAASLSGTLVRSAGENVGSYAIGQGTLSNANYAISFTGAQFAITPAPLSVFATNVTRLYGGTDPSPLPFTTSGLRLSDTAATALTGALARAPGENVGSYAITQGTLAASNYTISYTPGTLRIDPATLSVVASNQSRLYGDADPALTFAASGFVLGDTAGTALTGTLLRAAGENVGSYAIGQGSLSASNYVIAFTPGSFVINPAPLSVAAFDATREYGLADPLFTFAATGFRLGDTASVLTGALGRNPGENVGSYAITQGTLAASNYAISFTPGTLSITPATLSVAATPGGKTYGSPDPVLGFTPLGFRLGDTASILTGTLARDPGENVGTYAITLGSLSAGANYVISFAGALFTISPAALAVVAQDQSRLYGDADPILGFSAVGFVNGDTAATALTGALARAPGENVGSYAITQGSLAAANYIINFTPGTLAITPAPLSVVAFDATREYGLADPLFTFAATGFRLGDTASVLSGALARDPGETVGSYAIVQGTLAASNYAISYTPGTLSITPAELMVAATPGGKVYGAADPALAFTASGFRLSDTVAVVTGVLTRDPGENVGSYAITQGTLSASPNYTIRFAGAQFQISPASLSVAALNQARLYGDPDPILGFTTIGLVNGDTAASALTGALARAAGENVGSYAITQGTLAASNYTIAFTPGTLDITPAPLAVAANPGGKTYGASDPALGFTASGFRLSDTVASLTGSLVRDAGETVGAYAIRQGTLANPNYLISFTGATFTIDPALLRIAAIATGREYGLLDPALTYSAQGFQFADTAATVLTGGLVRAPGENVGAYAITQGSLAANTNYVIQFAGASFTITPARLAIVANPAEKTYGDADPALTYNATGFRLSDTAATVLTGALARAAGENAGTYAIGQGSLVANANYSVQFTGAAFTIRQRLLSLQLTGAVSRTYNATVTATITPANLTLGGVLPGDQVGATAAAGSFDTPNVGTAKQVTASGVTLTGASSGNYTTAATATAAIGTITQAPLTVRADDATRPFGVPNPPLTLQATGLFGSDTATSIGLEAVTAATPASAPGAYVIDVTGTPVNYAVTRIAGTLTVVPIPSFGRIAPELITVPGLGGFTQQGVATGVTAIVDTLDARSGLLPAPQPVLRSSRYTISLQPSAEPAGGPPAGSTAFESVGIR